jgi:hypothetical protein
MGGIPSSVGDHAAAASYVNALDLSDFCLDIVDFRLYFFYWQLEFRLS